MSLIIDRGLSSMARAEVGEYKEKKMSLTTSHVFKYSWREGGRGREGELGRGAISLAYVIDELPLTIWRQQLGYESSPDRRLI